LQELNLYVIADSGEMRHYCLDAIYTEWEVGKWRLLKFLLKFPVCDDNGILRLGK